MPTHYDPADPSSARVTHGTIMALIAVARAAHNLADNAEHAEDCLNVDPDDFDELSKALDELDELPEPGPDIVGTGAAKAEAVMLRPNSLGELSSILALAGCDAPDFDGMLKWAAAVRARRGV